MEAVGHALDQREEALASRRNVRAVLNVVRRPETLRSGVVLLVEKRFESLQHEGLILFLDCLRHFILLRYTPGTALRSVDLTQPRFLRACTLFITCGKLEDPYDLRCKLATCPRPDAVEKKTSQ